MHSILDGSPLALLYERDALTIFSYVLRRVSVREDAEDILLKVFLAAPEHETLANFKLVLSPNACQVQRDISPGNYTYQLKGDSTSQFFLIAT